jgi:hypothetical protein
MGAGMPTTAFHLNAGISLVQSAPSVPLVLWVALVACTLSMLSVAYLPQIP